MIIGNFRGKRLFGGQLFAGRLFGPVDDAIAGGFVIQHRRHDAAITAHMLRLIGEDDELLLLMTLAAGVGVLQ